MSKNSKDYSQYFFDQMAFAGFWVRIFAAWLDLGYILSFLGIFYFSLFYFFDFFTVKFCIYFGVFFHAFYYIFLTRCKWQATLGKRALCIIVGNKIDESRIDLTTSIARYIFSIFSAAFFLIHFLIVSFNGEKAALHDLICQTRVYYGKY